MSIFIRLPPEPDKLQQAQELDQFLREFNISSDREILFFDESIIGFVLLKTNIDIEHYKGSNVSINASIVPEDVLESGADLESGKYSTSLINIELGADDIIHQGASKDENYIIWKFEIPITYPKVRMSNPYVLFSGFISPAETEENTRKSVTADVKVLPDYKPSHSRNLLSGLNNQVLASDTEYQLTLESNLQETQSSIVIDETSRATLKATLSIPVSVSLVIKLKSTKPAGRNNILLSTLNIELSDELIKLLNEMDGDYYFSITNLSLDFKNGTIEDLNSFSNKLPVRFKLIDSINLTYKIINNDVFDKDLKQLETGSNMYQSSNSINIQLKLRVQEFIAESNTFKDISNIIVTNWSPFLDFSIIAPPINNSLKTTTSFSQCQSLPNLQSFKYNNSRKNNIYKLKPPSSAASLLSSNQLSNGISNPIINNNKRFNKSLLNTTSASSVTVNLTTPNNSTLSGLKLTFEGKINLKLGEIVNWNLQAINNSPNKLYLSLIVQNPISLNSYQKNPHQSNNTSSSNLLNSNDENHDVLVYNKPQLFALYNTLKLNTSGIIILNNDIRIGPLEPNSVFETSINLIGVSQGIFNLDGIKIFDTNSGDGLDFGKLVEVFVV